MRIILAVLCLFLGCGEISWAASHEVTAVILRDLWPLSFVQTKDNKPTGFAVDLTDAIAAKTDLKVRYLLVDNWLEVEESLKNGTADLCPILAVTEARKKVFAFSDFVETSGITINIRAQNTDIKGIKDLKGRPVGVIRESQAYYALRGNPEIRLLQFSTMQTALFELLSGHIDAFVAPDTTVTQLARGARIEDKIHILHPHLFEIKRAIAVRKDNTELLGRIAQTTEHFITTPEYQALYTKWHGSPEPYWNTKRILTASAVLFLAGITIFTFWRFRLMHKTIAEISKAEMALHDKAIELEQEIAERQKTQEELQAAKDAADAANHAKSLFLANMSHELRTPLNGVIGMAQLLEMTTVNNEQKEYLAALQFSANNLLMLIRDILDITKIEADQLNILNEEYSLTSCIDEAVRAHRQQLTDKKLNISVTNHQKIPDLLIGDRLRVYQIISNLLSNAVKFTDHGSICISTTIKEQHASMLLLDIAISDTGSGIKEQDIDRIFNVFAQADESFTRQHGGAGLGLALSLKLAGLMGGNITVESTPGSGSVFHLLLPSAVPSYQPGRPDEPETSVPAFSLQPLSILVAEDNRENQRYAQKLLEKMGNQVVLVSDGKQAVQAWKQHSFDLILMDIQMPVMCGDEAAMLIREIEGEKHTPIIAVTAHAVMGDRERLLQAGCDGYVAKPFQLQTLSQEIARVLHAQGKGTS